ncbi:MAG: restriction endonuclease subunit S [Proteobacteria bacterium]|nr:restriction endonuclease subunit S [Pseudomonadota bacterium]
MAGRTSRYPLLSLGEVLVARRETVQVDGTLGDWQAITIKFSGEVLPRERAEAFKGAMFAAYPGDLTFSKIDARNGAVGLIPDSIPKAVVTSEYPVFAPKPDKLRAAYLHHLLRAEHFKADLQRKASGTSGRKRVTPEGFLSLEVPVPGLDAQDALIATYTEALTRAAQLEQEADAIERTGWQAFEAALGVAAPPPLPDRPVFVARFKDVERWSHESILRSSTGGVAPQSTWPVARLGDVIADLENGWSPKCHEHPAREGKWGVLKLGAVSFGTFDHAENKELPSSLKPRPEYEVMADDVLISRANVARYVGACAYVESTPPQLLLCDKIFRVRFHANGQLLPRFLAEAMKLRPVREHIESRLTGTSPTMKNISKPALLDIRFPLPDLDMQQSLVDAIVLSRASATAKRIEAATLRQSAWATFEAALFTAPDEPHACAATSSSTTPRGMGS